MTAYIDDDGFVQGAERTPVCLMTFEQIADYIRRRATEYKKQDEAWQYEQTELEVGQQILVFAIKQGFEADSQLVDKALHDDQDRQFYFDEDELNYSTWHYLGLLLEQLDAYIAQKKLSKRTAFLIDLWQKEFQDSDES